MFLRRLIQWIIDFLRHLFGNSDHKPPPTPEKYEFLRCRNDDEQTAGQSIGPDGGRLEVAGNLLEVPPGAVAEPVEFSFTLLADEFLKIEIRANRSDKFEFQGSVTLTLSFGRCERSPDPAVAILKIDPETDRVLEVVGGQLDRQRQTVTASLQTLSRYTLGWPG
ncbi:MAG: hypothetical protein GEU90_02405 [Gemmatimonas sp.]|nr:hypothetical protein [Gemmatimonas sp.]